MSPKRLISPALTKKEYDVLYKRSVILIFDIFVPDLVVPITEIIWLKLIHRTEIIVMQAEYIDEIL